jgi:hypothetical protein
MRTAPAVRIHPCATHEPRNQLLQAQTPAPLPQILWSRGGPFLDKRSSVTAPAPPARCASGRSAWAMLRRAADGSSTRSRVPGCGRGGAWRVAGPGSPTPPAVPRRVPSSRSPSPRPGIAWSASGQAPRARRDSGTSGRLGVSRGGAAARQPSAAAARQTSPWRSNQATALPDCRVRRRRQSRFSTRLRVGGLLAGMLWSGPFFDKIQRAWLLPQIPPLAGAASLSCDAARDR